MGQVKVLTSTFKRRAKLLSRGLEYAVIAAIFITLLVIVAFASVAVGFNEVYGATVMFVLALSFFAASLICLWLEVRIASGSIDQVF
jgi:heme A synthase